MNYLGKSADRHLRLKEFIGLRAVQQKVYMTVALALGNMDALKQGGRLQVAALSQWQSHCVCRGVMGAAFHAV